MYAVIETGGKQYKVKEGDRLKVEKLDAQVGDKLEIDKVLMVADKELKIGKPYLEGASVLVNIKDQSKHKRIVIGKFRPKSGYRRTRGHRQPYSLIEVESIKLK